MDLALIENRGNGGDFVRKTKDLLVIEGFQNMPYLALFGGNKAASTPVKRIITEQAFDWFGNSLFIQLPAAQMNSETERVLDNVALTSSGRVIIENSVKKDLAFMETFAVVTVVVTIPTVDKVRISITLRKPDNLQSKEFVYIWDQTKKELLDPYNPNNTPDPVESGFDYFLDFEIE